MSDLNCIYLLQVVHDLGTGTEWGVFRYEKSLVSCVAVCGVLVVLRVDTLHPGSVLGQNHVFCDAFVGVNDVTGYWKYR